jgi:hypothetical protein
MAVSRGKGILRPFDARRFEKLTTPFDASPNDSPGTVREETTGSGDHALFSVIIAHFS